jgi:hypothetical protein
VVRPELIDDGIVEDGLMAKVVDDTQNERTKTVLSRLGGHA